MNTLIGDEASMEWECSCGASDYGKEREAMLSLMEHECTDPRGHAIVKSRQELDVWAKKDVTPA